MRGRGIVVTGSLRGGPLATGDRLRLVPGGRDVRVREIQVHGERVDAVDGGGRTALNLAGLDLDDIHRGDVLTADPEVVATDRLLVTLDPAPPDRSRWRLHLGTAAVEATVGRAGRDALPDAGIVRLGVPVAARPGDRFVLRRPGAAPVGGRALDVVPPRGLSRRRQTPDRVAALASATGADAVRARVDLHGAIVADGRVDLAPDVTERLDATRHRPRSARARRSRPRARPWPGSCDAS